MFRITCCRIFKVIRVIYNSDAKGFCQNRTYFLRGYFCSIFPQKFYVYSFRVSSEHWYTNSCAGNFYIIREVQNFTCFVCNLHFFFCVTVFAKYINLRNYIKRNRFFKTLVFKFFAFKIGFGISS